MEKRIRIIGLLLMLAVGTTSLFAMPDHEIFTDFYTDETLGEWCGYRYVTCSGIIRSGCQTNYYTQYDGFDC